jgi:hypothetical protein
MVLGPAQVHPQEHLGPVGRLGAAGTGADRQDRRALVVLAGEQQGGALPAEVLLERGGIPVELGLELGIGAVGEQLERDLEIVGTGQQVAPRVELGAEAVGLAKDLLGAALVVPEAGFLGQRLESGDPLGLGLEVKDAPRSTGSARPGRGRRMPPLVPDLEILEQERAQLDEPQGRLAPGDDGVHAGTVAVVWTDATVAIAIQGRSVAAGAAITLACDQIDERGFLGLLHGPSLFATRWARAVWAGSACLGARAAPRRQVLAQYTRPIPQRQEGTFRLPGGGPRRRLGDPYGESPVTK